MVSVRNEKVQFSPRECEVLRLLVAHARKVLTHDFILREIWGSDADVRYPRAYVRALRQKIEGRPGTSERLGVPALLQSPPLQ